MTFQTCMTFFVSNRESGKEIARLCDSASDVTLVNLSGNLGEVVFDDGSRVNISGKTVGQVWDAITQYGHDLDGHERSE